MKKFIFMILIILFTTPAFSQTGVTAPMFGLDQCLWLEDSDASVVNNYCARMIVEDGTLTDNANGSFTYSPAGAGYVKTTDFDTSAELAAILTDETGSGAGGLFGMKAVFSIDPVIENSDPDLGPTIIGKVQRSAAQVGGLLVNDDDCGRDQGEYWYDDAELRFEFCDDGSGLPITFQDFVNVVSSTDNAITRFDGTAGEVQNSGVTLDDNNDLTGDGALKVIGGVAANNTLNLQSNSAGAGNTANNQAINFLVGDTLLNAMTILQDGRIGIGTTAPTSPYRLQIRNDTNASTISSVRNSDTGTAAYALQAIETAVGALYLYKFGTNYSTSGRFVQNSSLVEGSSAGGLGIAASSNVGEIRFYTNASTQRMTIKETGLIGIGTSAPQSILDLNSASSALRVTRVADPSTISPSRNGMIAYDSTDNELQGYIGGTWKDLGKQGDLVGPASSTDNAITRFDSTTGKLVQNSGVLLDDNNNIVLPTTTASSTNGFIYKGSQRWLHDYYPTGAPGGNIFLGLDAGNFTSSWTGGDQGSYNIGIGFNAMNSLTLGAGNIAIGKSALDSLTTGSQMIGIGTNALQSFTDWTGIGGGVVAIGHNVGTYATGGHNTLLGNSAGLGTSGLSTYHASVIVGSSAGSKSQTNNYSTFIGRSAGNSVTTGVGNIIIGAMPDFTNSLLVSGGSNILIGGDGTTVVNASSSSASNELNIGNALYGTGMYGTGKIGIGITTPTARLHLPAGTTSASSAPLKLNSGSLMTAPEAGAIEFLTDGLYYTKTTGPTRVQIATTSDGYVVGPASSVDNTIVRFDSTTGKLIQDGSGITIDDSSNIALPAITNSSSNGTIYKGTVSAANRFIHTYMGATTTLKNIFIGYGAGNFTMASAGPVYEAGLNIGIGESALSGLTRGYSNTAIGYQAGILITTGQDNLAIGQSSLTKATTAGNNTAIGSRALQYNTGSFNFCMGNDACGGVNGSSTGGSNVAVGFQAGKAITTGANNMAFGYLAGTALNSGASNVLIGSNAGDSITTGASNIVIGKSSDTTAVGASNELNIGDVVYGTGMYGTGKIGIGITGPTARLHLPAGTATASTAPLKFNSGTLLTAAEAGAVEFLTDKFYGTITTGAARKELTLNDAALTSGTFPVATTNGRLTDSAFTSTTLTSGTYTPTRSAEANLDSNVTMTQAQYLRVGNTVTVSGAFTADPTTTATATSFEITLPVASNIGATDDAAGVAFSGSIAGQGAEVIGSIANNTAVIKWIAIDVSSQSWSYHFSYQVL